MSAPVFNPQYPTTYPTYPSTYQQSTAKFMQPGYSPTPGYGYPAIARKEVPSPPVIAELPAEIPPGLATTQQQNEDEKLAQQLQQLEVDEARRRSSTLSIHQPSIQSFYAPSTPDLRSSYIEPNATKTHARSVSSLSPHDSNSFVRPQSQVFPAPKSPIAPYGPDSFARPIALNPSTLPEVVEPPRPVSYHSPVNYVAPSLLPEVVAHPNSVSSSGESFIEHPTAHLPPAPADHTLLPMYLEQHRQVPYPPQWRLPPLQATFYSNVVRAPKSESWLDTPASQQWTTVRLTELAKNPTPPSFRIDFKKSGTFGSQKFAWSMSIGEKGREWKYKLKMEPNNKVRKSEELTPPKGSTLLTTYVGAPNYDTLRFVGPDGRQYKWVSHAPVSAVGGARYDTLRHALFAATYGNHDPLYGEIVADHTYWDGFVDCNERHHGAKCDGCASSPIVGLRWKCKSCPDHDICEGCRSTAASVKPTCFFTLVNLPDEVLYIRSRTVDPALVVATLQILKDWELHSMRWQQIRDPKGFALGEENIRKGDLGRVRHWKAEDFDKKGQLKMDGQVFGTSVKMKEMVKMSVDVAAVLGDAGGSAAS